MSPIVSFVSLLGIAVFLVLPLAILSFYDTSRVVRTAVVLAMCVVVSILAMVIEDNEGRQLILVCAYCAIMSSFLSQSS